MASYNKYEVFAEDLIEGVHDFDGHVFRVALSNAAPNAATHAVLAQAGEIAAGNGYGAGGAVTTITTSRSGGTAKVTGTDVTFTAAGGSIGPFRYAILYNDTPTSPADPLIAWWDYGTSLTVTSGNSFTVDFDGTNGILSVS
jgi:hypothetical protein